jgi:hypothetical protein
MKMNIVQYANSVATALGNRDKRIVEEILLDDLCAQFWPEDPPQRLIGKAIRTAAARGRPQTGGHG